ncbi:uncharacterized protein TNCV_1463571 [Trichonephila clavipes]|uniref:EB domain-containing protein n=1 Tax=Trichonephila clavipes TaxID=2585209 RepID=A0A8X6SFF2_TRICX|nr:uncharacterized protein TNCV_1463571 [Trichonephila clavipes]
MSLQDGSKPYCPSISLKLLFMFIYIHIYISLSEAYNFSGVSINNPVTEKVSFSPYSGEKSLRLFKRNSGKRCVNTTDCSSEIRGSLCIQNTCVCPQGYLPIKKGVVGCFQVGKHLGNFCNSSAQCGDELTCKNHVCLCPEGFQLYQTQGTNICLMWHKPTRLVDRCRLNEDCTRHDPNTICKKRWCQCNNGYQLFETMLFGRKHKCFKTYRFQCANSAQCSKLTETPDQHCMCLYGFCHCITDMNFTSFDIPSWADKPNWYQRWKKDLILATRLLFITVILFFVPCFIYVTLGMRERSRQLFSQFVQPTRSPVIHYSQRRNSHLRSLPSYRGLPNMGSLNNRSMSMSDSHHVEIALHSSGVNSRLVDSRPRVPVLRGCQPSREFLNSVENDAKEEDPPPSYEEIMHKEVIPEEPPPPYRAL